jgi:hypothetical protein
MTDLEDVIRANRETTRVDYIERLNWDLRAHTNISR